MEALSGMHPTLIVRKREKAAEGGEKKKDSLDLLLSKYK